MVLPCLPPFLPRHWNNNQLLGVYIIKSLSSSLVSKNSSILTSAYTIFADGACSLLKAPTSLSYWNWNANHKTFTKVWLAKTLKICRLRISFWHEEIVMILKDLCSYSGGDNSLKGSRILYILYIDVKITGLHKKLSGAQWLELVQDNLPLLCLPLSIVCFFATQLLEKIMESNAALHNIWNKA